jgi:hypothetical protein
MGDLTVADRSAADPMAADPTSGAAVDQAGVRMDSPWAALSADPDAEAGRRMACRGRACLPPGGGH